MTTIDTDSIYIMFGKFFNDIGVDFDRFDDSVKIKILSSLSKPIEKFVNDNIYKNTQKRDYNSIVDDFKIRFETEKIMKTALFIKKKKYTYWVVYEDGEYKDKVVTKGLEIIRSDSSEAIRVRMRKVYDMIVKKEDESKIKSYIKQSIDELKTVSPEEIAANIGVNNIDKYLSDESYKLGTPWHVKGVFNHRMLLKSMDLFGMYPDIHDGQKVKVLYLKPNQYNIDVISFSEWIDVFDDSIEVDYDKMIDKFFVNKIRFLLEPMQKDYLLKFDEVSIENFFS